MGRKSTNKIRKDLSPKMEKWVDNLISKLQSEDISKLTLDDIATKSNISKSTIYEYFATKENIIETMVKRRIVNLDQFPRHTKDANVLESYSNVINWLCENLDDISFDFMYQLKEHFPESWEHVRNFSNELIETLKQLYIEGIESGIFKDTNIDLMIGLDEYFILKWLTINRSKDKTIQDLVYSYVDLRLNGLINTI